MSLRKATLAGEALKAAMQPVYNGVYAIIEEAIDLQAANRALAEEAERWRAEARIAIDWRKTAEAASLDQLITEHNAMKVENERLRVALAKCELERASAIEQRDQLAKIVG